MNQNPIGFERLKSVVELKGGLGELPKRFSNGYSRNQLDPRFEEKIVRNHSPMQGCVSDRPVSSARNPEHHPSRVLEGFCQGKRNNALHSLSG